ncbi:hypothetical protein H4Q26_017437 [Puccinia striiformis f. sp. tritici PST-130]|nr:hypothetical protein H4Q26_017437 [Puccinia striiformis f. sp. tritici PST-130]
MRAATWFYGCAVKAKFSFAVLTGIDDSARAIFSARGYNQADPFHQIWLAEGIHTFHVAPSTATGISMADRLELRDIHQTNSHTERLMPQGYDSNCRETLEGSKQSAPCSHSQVAPVTGWVPCFMSKHGIIRAGDPCPVFFYIDDGNSLRPLRFYDAYTQVKC